MTNANPAPSSSLQRYCSLADDDDDDDDRLVLPRTVVDASSRSRTWTWTRSQVAATEHARFLRGGGAHRADAGGFNTTAIRGGEGRKGSVRSAVHDVRWRARGGDSWGWIGALG